MKIQSTNYSLGSEFRPQLILIQKDALQYDYCDELCSRLDVFRPEYSIVNTDEDARMVLRKKKKRHLYLCVNRGQFIRKKTFGQDCTSFEEAYCLDHIVGCHFSCSYCYLHSYLKNESLVRIFVNIDDMFDELDCVFSQKKTLFISTGELSDSLLFEPITHMTQYLHSFLKDRPTLFMELRSKSGYFQFISNISPLPNFCLTWSLSPQSVVKGYEFKTASLENRLLAMKKCQDAGLSTGIIVDPMIHYPQWERDYAEMVRLIAETIDLKQIHRLFIGSFRYRKKMDQDIKKKFPKTDLLTGEFVLARDGKYRYYKPLREKMYSLMKDEFARYGKLISLSMEFPETWSKILSSC